MTNSFDKVLTRLAREAIETFLSQGQVLPIANISIDLPPHGGVFVTIYKDGELRGCIGTPKPVRTSLEEEIIHNAISAATQDPRFKPIDVKELKDCTISIDILSPLEKVSDIKQLNPGKYGILVKSGSSRGLLLPDIPEIDTVQEQLHWAAKKAGIDTKDIEEIWFFSVRRLKEYGD